MSSYQYFVLVVVSIVAWLIVIDPNVAEYLTLVYKIVGVKTKRFFWMLKYHPNNFLTTWIRNHEYHKIAKELEEEFAKKQ